MKFIVALILRGNRFYYIELKKKIFFLIGREQANLPLTCSLHCKLMILCYECVQSSHKLIV